MEQMSVLDEFPEVGEENRDLSVSGAMGQRTVIDIFRDVGEGSTLHGIPKIVSSKHVVIKIVWASIVIGASVLLALQLGALYVNYRGYPTQTSIRVHYGPLQFPAITICNINPIQASNLNKFLNVISALGTIEHAYWSQGNVVTDIDAIESGVESDWDVWKMGVYRRIRNAKQSVRLSSGQDKNEFITQATFNEYLIPGSKITEIYCPNQGKCFTIDINEQTDEAGPQHGMHLVLYVDKGEYITPLVPEYGAIVVLHEPGAFPVPQKEGHVLNPGQHTYIAASVRNIKRLGEPYGNCVDSEAFRETYGYNYSIPTCQNICLRDQTNASCKCVPAESLETSDSSEIDGEICERKNSCKQRIVQDLIRTNYEGCNCRGRCQEIQYTTSISSVKWPRASYLQEFIYGDACSKNIPSLTKVCRDMKEKRLNVTDENYAQFAENFVGVTIYFESLVYENLTEEALYSTIGFLSDVGGSMGFFLGASVITYLELLHLVAELVMFIYGKWHDRVTVLKQTK